MRNRNLRGTFRRYRPAAMPAFAAAAGVLATGCYLAGPGRERLASSADLQDALPWSPAAVAGPMGWGRGGYPMMTVARLRRVTSGSAPWTQPAVTCGPGAASAAGNDW